MAIRTLACILLLVGWTLALAGEGPAPIASGDIIAYDVFKAAQVGNQPVTFEQSSNGRNLKITIKENGDRDYAFVAGKNYSVTDAHFTGLTSRGKEIIDRYRFQLFPPDKQRPVPGKRWNVTFSYMTSNWGENNVSYDAVAKDGPELPVAIDGTETLVRTVAIEYTGTITNSRYAWSGRAEHEVWYSPALDEIVRRRHADFDDKGFLMSGYSWTVRSIVRAPSPPTSSAVSQ